MMSLRSVFLRSRHLLGQLVKHKRAQNDRKHKFASGRHCHQIREDCIKPRVIRRYANPFQRYGLFRALPEANFKGFASLLRRSATMRLMASRDQVLGRGSLFAFVGISMVGAGGVGLDYEFKSGMKEENAYDEFCSIIRNAFQREKQESTADLPDHVSGYEFHNKPLGNGCNGLIFAARVKEKKAVAISNQNEETKDDDWVLLNEPGIQEEDDGWNVVEVAKHEESACRVAGEKENKVTYPVALKMAFNFFASSNSDDIFREYERELVPLKNIAADRGGKMATQLVQRSPLKHPNIVTLYTAFVDDEFPQLDYIHKHHPACLPSDLNPGCGLGRNMTLFVAMKRYDMNLKQYLHRFGGQSERVAMVMLAQLLEGVTYLVSQGIAHRDLKSDNILVEIHESGPCKLIITDFGCCLVQNDRSLYLPYTSSYVDRGGNSALMAPEIKLAIPGEHTTISYFKSDAWAVGSIAYEIVGLPNPFSGSQSTGTKCLDSRTYEDTDLPGFGDNEHKITHLVSHMLLKRDTEQRLAAEVAADVLHLFLWQPQYWRSASWCTGHVIPTRDHVISWLGMLYTDQCMKRLSLTDPYVPFDNYITEDNLCHTFLKRVYINTLMEAVNIRQTFIVKEFLASERHNSISKL
ncbi:serine/threonine-protein kinase pink-1, mitochondrial-like [Anneissia japonica]|uniref:serine/threonine-protein kinase pink-1, mitochondrial-like n=1 Tax=Anneissia japonica TaxID=1529436 RepID=UPI0014259F3D|nr:serine/threonine-protein kinase pink-1, mitochondrial-like [Anneissia japonica]